MYTSLYVPTARSSNKDENGNPVVRLVDCVKGSYTRNAFGFIRNDFSELASSQDLFSLQKALNKMQEIYSNEPDNRDKSFEEIVAMVRPRLCQSPAELDRFELYCIDNALDFYGKLKKLDDDQKEAIAKAKQKQIDELRSEFNLLPKVDNSPVDS